jgi:hypothetical protein
VPDVPEVQDLKSYYAAFLSAHPEDIVRKQLDEPPVLARACHEYLDPGDIIQICKVPNLPERIEKLLPYFLFKGTHLPNWDDKPEMRGIDTDNLRGNDAKNQLIL